MRVIVELRHRDGNRGSRMAAESRGEPASSDPTESTLQLQYGEICKSHEAISQFRAKLLALLPIASGAGALVLLGPLSDARNLRFFFRWVFTDSSSRSAYSCMSAVACRSATCFRTTPRTWRPPCDSDRIRVSSSTVAVRSWPGL